MKFHSFFDYLGKNSIEYILLYYAASKSGAVPVPLNYRLAPPEWEYILNDSESKLIIADEEFCDGIDSIRPNLVLVNQTIAIGDGVGGIPEISSDMMLLGLKV